MHRSLLIIAGTAALSCRVESSSSMDALHDREPEAGGQTGGEVHTEQGHPTGNGAFLGGNCEDQASTVTDPEAETPLGFSVARILEFSAGVHQATLNWDQPVAFTRNGQVPAQIGPESGQSEIEMIITPQADDARFVSSTQAETATNGNIALGGLPNNCVDRVEVDVEVTFASAGGAFDERWSGTLIATTPYLATLSLPFEMDELMGSLSVELPVVENATLRQFSVEAQLGPSGLFTGSIGGTVEQNDGVVASAGPLQLATWGDSPCEPYEVPIALTENLRGFAPEDLLAVVNSEVPLTLTWQDGSVSELELSVSTQRSAACLSTINTPPQTQVYLPAELHATSTDGRVDSELGVDLFGTADEAGNLAELNVVFNGAFGKAVPAAEFQTRFGIAGVDLTGYERGTITFQTLYVVAGAGSSTGTLEVFGVIPAMCDAAPADPDSMATAGCAGDSFISLDAASW